MLTTDLGLPPIANKAERDSAFALIDRLLKEEDVFGVTRIMIHVWNKTLRVSRELKKFT